MEMHEVVCRVVEIIDDEAYRHSAQRVTRVHLALGGRSPLDAEQLRCEFLQAARGTVAEGAELQIDIEDVHRHCRSCGHDFSVHGTAERCPACGHPRTKPLDGEQVRVVDIVVDDLVPA